MADLIFSVNTVLPLFLIMALGFVLKSRAFISDAFVESGTAICFYVALPCLLFLNIIHSDFSEAFDTPLILLCAGGLLISAALLQLLTPRFIRSVYTSSAFIQTSFNSNHVLLGLPFIYNLAGSAGLTKAGATFAFTVPICNILAVLMLAKNKRQGSNKQMLLANIVKNPLIIAALLAVLGSLLSIRLPLLLERSLTYLSDMAMPLALFTLGASVHFQGEAKKLRLAASSAVLKLTLIPLIAVLVAVKLGFNPVQMAVTLAVFAGPPAVSCFPMAFQMGADQQLTSQAIVVGTGLSAITMFAFVFILRVLGLV